MEYACEFREQPFLYTLVVRRATPLRDLPRVLDEALASVGAYLGRLSESPSGPPFTAYYNRDPEALEIEAGYPVAKALPGKGPVEAGVVPEQRVAVCMHVGPYGEIDRAYAAMARWLAGQEQHAAEIAYEFYLNEPASTPPELRQTEILVPLRLEP